MVCLPLCSCFFLSVMTTVSLITSLELRFLTDSSSFFSGSTIPFLLSGAALATAALVCRRLFRRLRIASTGSSSVLSIERLRRLSTWLHWLWRVKTKIRTVNIYNHKQWIFFQPYGEQKNIFLQLMFQLKITYWFPKYRREGVKGKLTRDYNNPARIFIIWFHFIRITDI